MNKNIGQYFLSGKIAIEYLKNHGDYFTWSDMFDGGDDYITYPYHCGCAWCDEHSIQYVYHGEKEYRRLFLDKNIIDRLPGLVDCNKSISIGTKDEYTSWRKNKKLYDIVVFWDTDSGSPNFLEKTDFDFDLFSSFTRDIFIFNNDNFLILESHGSDGEYCVMLICIYIGLNEN